MANENQMAVAQTNTVDPSQANKVINNIDKISDTQTPVPVLQGDKETFNDDVKNNFLNSEAWKAYTSNDLRKLDPNTFPGFAAIERLSENPIWTATVDKYGDAIVKRQQALAFSYAKPKGFFSKLGHAYNAQRYGLRASEARKALSDAMMTGDQVAIEEARAKYQNELKDQYLRGYAYDDETANTLMSLFASAARNPETIPIEIVGAALIPYTYGASELAARGINAAIVGTDTFKTDTGNVMQQIDDLGLGLSEEEIRKKAIPVGVADALIEAGAFGLGGNIAGAGTRYIGKRASKAIFKKGVENRLGREISDEVANRLYKVKFLSELQKGAAKAGFGQVAKDFALEGAGQAVEEVVQDTNVKTMLAAIQNDTTWGDELTKEWASFAKNPFAPEHADKWKTFLNIMITSPALSGTYRGIGVATNAGVNVAMGKSNQKKLDEIKTKFAGATTNTLGLSRLYEWHQDGDAKDAIGAANAALQEAIATDPNVTGKLYTTVEQVQEMQKDPEVAQALEQMGVAQGLEQAEENGGSVELDLMAYDKIVNEKQNTKLFQKMRNYLSFSSTTMSVNEFQQFIRTNAETITKQITEEVKNDADSIYNKVKNTLLEAGEDNSVAEAYGIMAHIKLSNMQGFTQGQQNDILSRLTISVADRNGGTITRTLGKPKSQTQTTNVSTPQTTQITQGLPAVDASTFTTFDKNGKLNDATWQQIRNLFSEDKLQQVYTSDKGGSRTFEELLRGTVDKPQQVAREHAQHAIEVVANEFGITPEQLRNAIRLARGEAISTEPGTADVNVGGIVDNTFTDRSGETTEVIQEPTEEQKEEQATAEITTSTSATIGQPVDIIFDIHDKDSTFENNFKKNGEIKETVKRRINELFLVNAVNQENGMVSELYKLIGDKNAKWIANDVKSTDIVNFANRYKVSPNAVYRAVNIARGQPEARVKVIMPSDTLTPEDRKSIIDSFVERNAAYNANGELKASLDKLSDYELRMLCELDPAMLYVSPYDKEKML